MSFTDDLADVGEPVWDAAWNEEEWPVEESASGVGSDVGGR
jgi:hypothetical protein